MEPSLTQTLDALPGVGPARAKALARLGLYCVEDLLDYFPRSYEDRSVRPSLEGAPEDVPICFVARVTEPFYISRVRTGMELCRGRISDSTAQISVSFFNQSYVSKALVYGESYVFYGKLTAFGGGWQMANPYFEALGEGKLTGGIMPLYPLTAGLSQKMLAGLVRRVLPTTEALPELLPPELLQEYQLAQTEFSHQNIHFPASWEALALARRRLVFEELLCLSLGLSLLRQRRQEGGAPAFTERDLSPFYASLPFALTGAQHRALTEITQDLGQEQPMSRLLQGDVGSGKTAVAAAACYLAWKNGLQSALMAPTDLLARQHYSTLAPLLGALGLRVGLLLGAMTDKQKRDLRAQAACGEVDLLIGTHALLTHTLHFAQLGLVVTDEQHRFGVAQRAKLSAKAGQERRAHVLLLSATPIPRTLALMIYGDLDLSVLNELPPGRTPVSTLLVGEDKRLRLYAFVRKQVASGRQVYIVCPTVEEGDTHDLKAVETHGAHLQSEVFPDLTLGILHGRRRPKEKEAILSDFAAGTLQVLISTTVIEVGIDVPNATLMIIENAERFGLSQLHQLRGRVGRGAAQSYCVLITDTKNEESRARLRALCASTDGFHIAEEDLRLRGPGDFFGARQHGLPQLHIADLAGDMRVLKEAQNAAISLLAQDPTLEQPAHQALHQRMLHLFAEQADNFSAV